MKSIDYNIKLDERNKDKNQEIIAETVKRILNDWKISSQGLDNEEILKCFMMLDEKSKMIYQNLEGHDNLEDNLDLYTDICLSPQNVLYEDIGFDASLSISININEIKVKVAEFCIPLLIVKELTPSKLSAFAVNLLVLLIKDTKYIPNDISRCVLKIIAKKTLNASPKKEMITLNEIESLFETEYVCPILARNCIYYNTLKGKCTLSKDSRKSQIKEALNQLQTIKAIQCPDPESDNSQYGISRLIYKE